MIEPNQKPPNEATEELVDKTSNVIKDLDNRMNEACPEDVTEVNFYFDS